LGVYGNFTRGTPFLSKKAKLQKEAFGRLFWASGYPAGADQAQEIVVVADGAAWIWGLVTRDYPRAVQILDWSHAVAYLYAVQKVWSAGGEVDEAQAWLEAQKAALWEGQVADVIQACCRLAEGGGPRGEAAAKAVTYYEHHRHRMDYGRFREAGYRIGSGTVERAIKRVVTARMKVSGAHWMRAGGEATLKARTALLSHLETTRPQPLAA